MKTHPKTTIAVLILVLALAGVGVAVAVSHKTASVPPAPTQTSSTVQSSVQTTTTQSVALTTTSSTEAPGQSCLIASRCDGQPATAMSWSCTAESAQGGTPAGPVTESTSEAAQEEVDADGIGENGHYGPLTGNQAIFMATNDGSLSKLGTGGTITCVDPNGDESSGSYTVTVTPTTRPAPTDDSVN